MLVPLTFPSALRALPLPRGALSSVIYVVALRPQPTPQARGRYDVNGSSLLLLGRCLRVANFREKLCQKSSFGEFCMPEARFPRRTLLGSSVNRGDRAAP